MPILSSIDTPEEKAKPLRHTVLLYGPPKVGKTQMVGELAKIGYNLDWYDLEDGSLTLAKLPIEAKARVNLHRIRDSQAVPIAAKTMRKVFDPKTLSQDKSICVNHGLIGCTYCTNAKAPFEIVNPGKLGMKDVIVIDSGTQLSRSFMSEILLTLKDSKGNVHSVDDKPEFDHYMTQGAWLNTFFDCMKILDCHFIFITHETVLEQEDKVKKMYPIAGTSAYAMQVPRQFSHVVYASLQNKLHSAVSMTTSASGVISGSRTDSNVEKPSIAGNPLSAIFPSLL